MGTARTVIRQLALRAPPLRRLYERNGRLADENWRLAVEQSRLAEESSRLAAEKARLGRENRSLAAAVAELSDENQGRRERLELLEAALAEAEARAGAAIYDTHNYVEAPAASAPTDIDAAIEYARSTAAESGPRVSIVCVVRNGARYLRRAIASMRAQTYADLEILIQDGGSTDGTIEIIRDEGFEEGLVSEPDGGAMDALFKAAERAQGEIVACCWADDELLPHALGWAVNAFQRYDADAIYGDQLVVFERHRIEQLQIGQEWDIRRFARQDFYPPFSSAFFRREALVALAGQLPREVDDEYEFWLRLGLHWRLRHAKGLVSRFHVHGGTRWIVPGYTERMVPYRLRALRALMADPASSPAIQPLLEEALDGTELWAALHEVSVAGSVEEGLKHLARIDSRCRDDPRTALTLARLISLSMRNDSIAGDQILRTAHRLGFKFGVARA